MAEQLFGLGADDIPRVKRLLSAFEAGQLNTQDPPGRRPPPQRLPPFQFGYLSTNSTGYLPNSTAAMIVYTTTGAVSTGEVAVRNLSADRIDKLGASSPKWAPQKVSTLKHPRSGETYFERVPSIRRLQLAFNLGKSQTAVTGDYVTLAETTVLSPLTTTGFSFAKQGATTEYDTIVIADPGIYHLSFSVNCEPTDTSGVGLRVEISPVEGAADSAFSPTFATNLISRTTGGSGGYLSPLDEIPLQGFGYGFATTANTKLRLHVGVSLSAGTPDARLFGTKLTLSGTVYV